MLKPPLPPPPPCGPRAVLTAHMSRDNLFAPKPPCPRLLPPTLRYSKPTPHTTGHTKTACRHLQPLRPRNPRLLDMVESRAYPPARLIIPRRRLYNPNNHPPATLLLRWRSHQPPAPSSFVHCPRHSSTRRVPSQPLGECSRSFTNRSTPPTSSATPPRPQMTRLPPHFGSTGNPFALIGATHLADRITARCRVATDPPPTLDAQPQDICHHYSSPPRASS